MTRFLATALFAGLVIPLAASTVMAADLDYDGGPAGYVRPDYRRPLIEERRVVEERRIVEERPVVVERRVVVERPIVVERPVERLVRRVDVEPPVFYGRPRIYGRFFGRSFGRPYVYARHIRRDAFHGGFGYRRFGYDRGPYGY